MDKIETFKALLPFIPVTYRRPLLFYIHFEEMMNIMASLRSCLNSPLPDYSGSMPKDSNELMNILKKNMSKQDSEMVEMISGMQNMSSLFSAMNNMGDLSNLAKGMNAPSGETKSDNDFSEEIDDLFKDFIAETK